MSVYKAINAVQAELAKTGIGKDSTNTFDNYKFRGIDAVYNALSPLMAKHGLCVLPRMLSRACEERVSKKGDPVFYVTVDAEFDFVCAEDGSKHTVKTYGEAMDRGDKATNKAMSAAYKYAAFQTFAIPTEGDNDADATTHEVAAKDPVERIKAANVQPTAGVADGLDARVIHMLNKEAEKIARTFETDKDAAFDMYMAVKNDKDTKYEEAIYLWTQLDSKVKSAIKKIGVERAGQALVQA